ncbi:ThuA domain-containing protein [Streptomyces bohaiensis]|uniref:ThuA domain-containing protein n=1 Tax=Streptomyces bohaiensis TaxID=1431344 RepID=UPI0028A97D06|nr:ThuA domain-containing protein [Streptomyces bohaiensis]
MTVGLLAAPAAAGGLTAAAHPGHDDQDTASVLVFSKTAGFRHDSIPAGIAAIEQLGEENGFDVTATEDASVFTDSGLEPYDAVVWLSTTGDVLDSGQQEAFERYIQAGGGYAGVHAASDTEYDWPWYGGLVGSYFASHPHNQDATVDIEDHDHPSTEHLDDSWTRYDEWYNFQDNPRDAVHVLASLDESSYSPGNGAMGDHPIVWCQAYDGGRSWYTGMGHTRESYSEPEFVQHLLGGIEYAAGLHGDGLCGGGDDQEEPAGTFSTVTLDDTTSNPMELAVTDDGRVLYIDRGGDVRLVRANGTATTAGRVEVYTGQEYGLLGIALDPAFNDNGHLYLYYSPAGGEAVDRVSRFTLEGETIPAASEEVVLEIGTQRQQCCHAGGALQFDGDGNLLIATGDITNPFASDGYTPIDERPGRELWDAQRTSANSANLNGKILRITPTEDGGYTVPEGNLFEAGEANTRAEIYAMGFRNPFRIGLDPRTDALLVADYGPDAAAANDGRGPDGRVEWNIVDTPGFYGWPYCVGDNTPYVDFDFATRTSGEPFDCSAPVNNSPNNDGVTELPPAIAAELWMGASSTGVPEIGTSGAPMTSGVYVWDEASESDRKWPASWDGKAVLGDWNNGRLFAVGVDGGEVDGVERALEELSFKRPHALRFGPDGALYVIDWGSGFGGDNTDSGVYRVDHRTAGGSAPVARLDTDVTSGPLPLEVTFSAARSEDPDGGDLTYAWDLDGDGTTDATDAEVTHTYTEAGVRSVTLTVTDPDGETAVAGVEINAGNSAPEITVEAPLNGGLFSWGDTIEYEVTVTDAEDGEIDCERVITQPALGHDEHAHPYEQYRGCSGSFPLPGDEGHVGANIFGVVTVTYTDEGAPGTEPLTTQEVVVLHTKDKEAEFFTSTGRVSDGAGADEPGVRTEATSDTGGGLNIGHIADGDWFGYEPMNLSGIDAVELRVASAVEGGTVEIRVGDPEGELIGSVEVTGTGGWQEWETVTAEIGDHEPDGGVYFVIRRQDGNDNTGGLLNVNWLRFQGQGVTAPEPAAVG